MSESDTILELGLTAKLEAMLFVLAEPAPIGQFAAALEITPAAAEKALKELDEQLKPRGLRLQFHAGRVQMTTAPEAADLIEKFLGLESIAHLSRAALETLAIVAYQQPVTRPQIDSIRGVNSDGMMKSLLSKNLVQEIGRAEGPGRPILYGTTPEFLQHFGLGSITELPPLVVPEPAAEAGAEQKDVGLLKG
jgi:segregation and condensation protein B